MNVNEAASLLGISPLRVRQMAQRGHIAAHKHGRDWDIPAAAIRSHQARPVGRPLAPARAWAAAAILAGQPSSWLPARDRAQVKHWLRGQSVDRIAAALYASLWHPRRFDGHPALLARAKAELRPAGAQAAMGMGLPIIAGSDGAYWEDSQIIEAVAKKYSLEEALDGELLVLAPRDHVGSEAMNCPEVAGVVLAINLARSQDPREQQVGSAYLLQLHQGIGRR